MTIDEAISHALEVAEQEEKNSKTGKWFEGEEGSVAKMKTVDDFKWEMYHCYPTSEYERCTHPAICCHMNYLAITMLLRGEY